MFYLLVFVGCSPKNSLTQPVTDPIENSVPLSAEKERGDKASEKGQDITENQLIKRQESEASCIAECLQSRQMEARGIEAITADCEKACDAEQPTLPAGLDASLDEPDSGGKESK